MHAVKKPEKPEVGLPSAFREPLREALAYWLGHAWMVRVAPSAGGEHPLDWAVGRLMAGQRAISLPHVDRCHLDHLKAAADRMAMTVIQGSRMLPDEGFTYRTVCCHGDMGVVLQLAVPVQAGADADGRLTVEAVFAAKDFNGMRAAIRKEGPWQMYGVSEDLADQYRPREQTQDRSLDLELDRPAPAPKMGFF